MSSTRERALDAAIRLVGTRGVRALTHARVDAEARLPKGSTSNYFRTRAALITGVIDSIAARERQDLTAATRRGTSADELIDALCEVLEDLTGRHAVRTRARYALFFEVTAQPEAQMPLRAQRAQFADWVKGMLKDQGAADAEASARILLAFCSGLIVHRLTTDHEAELRSVVAVAVHACLSN